MVDIYHKLLSFCFKIPASTKTVARFKTGIVLGISLLLTVISLFNVTPVVTKTEIILKDLPQIADGFVIVHISDLHLGPTVGLQFLKDIVQQVNSLQPDMIVMTGGIFDYCFTMHFQTQADQLALLRSKYGVFYVTGTSEYFGGSTESWGRVLSYLRFVVLHNDIVAIAKDNQTLFELAGVDDWYSGRFYSQWGMFPGPNLKTILKRSQRKPLILLAHNPTQFYEASAAGVDLQLSGRAMTGQIFPLNLLLYPFYPYLHGLHSVNSSTIYVTQGVGYWGPPMRLWSEAEISQIVLRTKASEKIIEKEKDKEEL